MRWMLKMIVRVIPIFLSKSTQGNYARHCLIPNILLSSCAWEISEQSRSRMHSPVSEQRITLAVFHSRRLWTGYTSGLRPQHSTLGQSRTLSSS